MERGERLNTITHLSGVALAVGGVSVLVVLAARQGDAWKIVSLSIYGATLVMLYAASAIYHGSRGSAKAVFRAFDHVAIYILIAGTYTPFTLVTLRGGWGWPLFGIVWGLAFIGIVQEILLTSKHRILSLVIYLLMGWLVIIALRPLLRIFPTAGVIWLVAGGVAYTGGILFYAMEGKLTHSHGIWHLCVLAGSGCHYIAILQYVL